VVTGYVIACATLKARKVAAELDAGGDAVIAEGPDRLPCEKSTSARDFPEVAVGRRDPGGLSMAEAVQE
jgi:hypothetical protein